MSWPGLFIALALSLIALAIVARPLLRPAGRERMAESGRRRQVERVESYYERVLTNIGDLDEDYSTGKVNEEEYRREREIWALRGIRLLRALDQLTGEDDDGLERAIDEAVAAYRESRLERPAEEEAS